MATRLQELGQARGTDEGGTGIERGGRGLARDAGRVGGLCRVAVWQDVTYLSDCIGDEVEAAIGGLKNGQVA